MASGTVGGIACDTVEQKAGKPVAGGRLAAVRKAIKLGKSM
jgi:hypothetical protein